MRTLLFFLLVSSNLFANRPEWIPDYFVHYEKDNHLSRMGSRIKIICEFDSDYNPIRKLKFGINGSDETIKLNDKNECVIIRKPQKSVFQFFYDQNFQEIETDSIEIKEGQITIISLHFKDQNEMRPVKKPVIYLYPEKDTELSVQLKPKGNLTFSYPEYSGGWRGTAHPDGSIDISGTRYPYLFWESEQNFNTFDPKLGGFILTRSTIVTSLENYLSELGFNDKEKADFITFWGPQLQQHEEVMIQFILNDACNEFASLNIEPKPLHLNRVYMIWSNTDNLKPQIQKPQVLQKLNRDGFDVLEWGGIELLGSAMAN
ncbi:MAG: hypothetical protein K0S23_1626 [Fluviicola sp.]|jgi:hypothetical protein|uniref:hypothetical protein n=1 Tax=Fluviicola sp. TaxID=1917219 RepID=UPI002610352C|nr:hypothetical protein [Fluviicola sp.]MDF3027319.1 hypothetical protein [Fluviicola sp.]